MTTTKRITITIIASVALIGLLLLLVKPSVAAYLITSSRQIKNGVIKGVDIRNGTITTADLARNSVGGGKIKDGSVGTLDITNNSVGGLKIKDGSVRASEIATNAVGDAEMIDDPTFDTVVAEVGVINYTSILGEFYVAEPYTISDNGGGTPASDTLDPLTSVEEITCEDANGCEVTMDNVNQEGFFVMIINVGTNNVTIVDDDTTADLSGDVDAVLGHNDVINLINSLSGVWLETGRSNN